MAKRHELRALYIAGWYDRDPDKLMVTTAADFAFVDPAEPEPVTRDGLAAYMERWLARTGGAGTAERAGPGPACVLSTSRRYELPLRSQMQWLGVRRSTLRS